MENMKDAITILHTLGYSDEEIKRVEVSDIVSFMIKLISIENEKRCNKS